MKKCPLCGKDSLKVIYYGMPMFLCSDDTCNCLYGAWVFTAISKYLPFNGVFYSYEGNCYLAALWRWLTVDFNTL